MTFEIKRFSVGRAGIVGDVILQSLDVSKGKIGLSGKIDDPNVEFAAEQFAAYVDSADEAFVPVRFVGPTAWDGFYRVTDVQASASQSKLLGLSVSLERVRGFAAPIFESVVLGSKRSGVIASVTPTAWHGVPATAVGYETGVLTPTRAVLLGETGDVQIFSEATNHLFNARPMWFLSPADWYAGAAELTVAGHVVTGKQVRNAPADWVLSNGLVRFSGRADGAVVSERWDAAGHVWTDSGAWSVTRSSSAIGPLGAAHTLTVLRNDPACVTVRLAYDAASNVAGSRFVVYLDVSLRRGSTVAECSLSTRGFYPWGFLSPVTLPTTANYGSFATSPFIACVASGTYAGTSAGVAGYNSRFYPSAGLQFVQWGWGYLAGRTQQQVAQMYAAAQSERTEVVAR